MLEMELVNEVSKEHDDSWWPLRQLESVITSAQNLPCFLSNDEISMNSFEYVDPLLEICLQKVKKVLSQHEEIATKLNRLKHLENINLEDSKPQLSEGIDLLEQYSELMLLEVKDSKWENQLDQLKNKMLNHTISEIKHAKPMAFIKKLIDENHIRESIKEHSNV